jgi:Spy/CpxP family protein refolding chaperone
MRKTTSRRAALVLGSILLAGAAGIGLAAQAPGGPGGPGFGRRGGPGGPMGRGGPAGALELPLGQLNLSGQQRDQVKAIMDAHNDELKALGDRQVAARQALDKAAASDAIDEGAIRQAGADLGTVETDMALARAHIRAEVLQILTADQVKQLKTLEANRPAPPQRGRGRGRA